MAARVLSKWVYILFIALLLGLTVGTVQAQQDAPIELSAEGGQLSIAQGKTLNIRTSVQMKDVLLSNDATIDVIVLDSRTLQIVSKGRGLSDLVIEGDAGTVIGQTIIEVLPPESSTVTIHRGGTLSTYSCRWGLCDYSAAQVKQAFAHVGILQPADPITPIETTDSPAATSDVIEAAVSALAQPSGRDRSGECAAQQGMCIAQCYGDGQCIGGCAAIMGVCMAGAAEQETASGTSASGMCIGNCAAQQGLCVANCNGDGQCVGQCAAKLGQCTARCTQ